MLLALIRKYWHRSGKNKIGVLQHPLNAETHNVPSGEQKRRSILRVHSNK